MGALRFRSTLGFALRATTQQVDRGAALGALSYKVQAWYRAKASIHWLFPAGIHF
jgi:hypothetical protein